MAKTPEEILEEARKLIGRETKPVKAKYPVEYEAIRRWCHMADNANPLFLTPEYANKTKYGGVICPPGAIQLVARRTWPLEQEEESLPAIPKPEGMDVPFAMGHEWEFLKPVKVGEQLWYKRRIANVEMKAMRYEPHTFWTTNEQIFMTEAGEVVCIFRSWGLAYRRVDALRKAGITDYPK
ncbi:MAG: MaoC family dehydratase N-terminal domain-containing protein [Dehalococcoidales bacterium]|nr:MaoC family dehydratase N-terminal domain-containing protein [Dehalococcoidales bacterium]